MEICKALTKNLTFAHWTFIEVFTVVIYSSVLFLPIVDYFYIQATSALFLSQQSGKKTQHILAAWDLKLRSFLEKALWTIKKRTLFIDLSKQMLEHEACPYKT